MDRIEFVGTSYVGKSTLYKALRKNINLNDPFMVEEQFRELSRRRMGWMIFWYRKSKEILIHALGGKYKLYPYPDFTRIDNETLNGYSYSLTLCYNNDVISKKGIAFATKTLNRLQNLISKYEFYESLGLNKNIIVEESYVHWHLVMHQLLRTGNLELPSNAKEDIGLFPKAIIYCYADEETILERIKLRAIAKKINRNHLNFNDQEVLQKVLEKQYVFQEYAKLAESFGVKVVRLNTANSIQDNIGKIKLFLKERL